MIATVSQPVSSVVRIAQEACAAEGVTLEVVRDRANRRRPFMACVLRRVVYRMRHTEAAPSFPQIARAFGMNGHSTVRLAFEQEAQRRADGAADLIDLHGLGGLVGAEKRQLATTTAGRPLYDDGEG